MVGRTRAPARPWWALLVAAAVVCAQPASSVPRLDVPAGRAVVRTCEGCALFSYPELKRFLVTQRDRYVDQYPNVDVKYERGLAPVLVVYSRQNVELARVDLTQHSTIVSMRALLRALGFEPQRVFAEETCVDGHDDCAWWARHGRCDTRFVRERCASSCQTCAKDEL